MLITAYFSNLGSPATGLSPTIDVIKVSDGSVFVNDDAMTELAGGFYKYDFTTYSTADEYNFICDGGATLTASERYATGATSLSPAEEVCETEGSYTLKQALSILLSICAGNTTNSGLTFNTPNGNATRALAVVNSANERTSMTLTPSS